MLTVEDEVELAKSILESERVRKYFNRELEDIKDKVPSLKMADDQLSTAETKGLSFKDSKRTISIAKEKSKLVFPLIDLLMVNRSKAKDDDEEEEEEEKEEEVITTSSKERERNPTKEEIRCASVLSIACYNRNRKCSGVQTILGAYFRERGVKDTELNMLHRIGISLSLTALDSFRGKLEVKGNEKPKEIVQSGDSVVANDNFEQMESIKEQIQGKAVENVDTDDVSPPSDATIEPRASKKVRIS